MIFGPVSGRRASSPFANALNTATKYVATHRPESLEWGPVKDLGADIVEGIRGIKSSDGPDLFVCGSTSLTSVRGEPANPTFDVSTGKGSVHGRERLSGTDP